MKVKKDQVIIKIEEIIEINGNLYCQNGEEYTEETYIDPSTGLQMHVIKKIIKDKDGNVSLFE